MNFKYLKLIFISLSLFFIFSFSLLNKDETNVYRINYKERKFYFNIQSFIQEKPFLRYMDFIKKNNISGITLYGLHKTLQVSKVEILHKIKSNLAEISIFIAGENHDFFKNIAENKYLLDYIDGFHIEFEYWNNYKYKFNSKISAFNYFINQLNEIKKLASIYNKKIELYLGWFDSYEANIFFKNIDIFSLHAYVDNENKVVDYLKERLITIYKINIDIPYFILLSSEYQFLGRAVALKGIDSIEKTIYLNFILFLKEQNMISLLDNFAGFYWFTGELTEKVMR